MPMSRIKPAAITAIAKFVAMVLSQGCQPLRNSPTGSRCFKINRYAGPMPNMTLGCRGEGIDIAKPTPFEMAGTGMMHGMRAAPEAIGRERQHADQSSHPLPNDCER